MGGGLQPQFEKKNLPDRLDQGVMNAREKNIFQYPLGNECGGSVKRGGSRRKGENNNEEVRAANMEYETGIRRIAAANNGAKAGAAIAAPAGSMSGSS